LVRDPPVQGLFSMVAAAAAGAGGETMKETLVLIEKEGLFL